MSKNQLQENDMASDLEMLGALKEEIILTTSLKSDFFSQANTLLFVDRNLLSLDSVKNLCAEFPHIILDAGEDLKTLASLQEVLGEVSNLTHNLHAPFTFVSLGGGSVGDFCGFLASIYHRGIDYIQCPTTWLSVIDSAHGGKTALNVQGVKNQVGSFYPARKIIIAQDLLKNLSPQTALGEVLKTILLAPKGSTLKKALGLKEPMSHEWLWQNLSELISVKNEIVRKDPKETQGLRHQLNLGHTVGHAIETLTKKSHSESVLWGLWFCLKWSEEKKMSTSEDLLQVARFLQFQGYNFKEVPKFLESEFESVLLRDKKRVSLGLRFVFYKKGQAHIRTVKVSDILKELDRQGFIKS